MSTATMRTRLSLQVMYIGPAAFAGGETVVGTVIRCEGQHSPFCHILHSSYVR